MIKKNSISKLLLGGFFLAIYCNVLFTQLQCAYEHLSESTEVGECPHDAETSLAEHSHKDSHKHNNSKDDNCCKDKTSAFFASQTNLVNSSFDFKNSFFTTVIHFSCNFFVFSSSVNLQKYFSYQSPPPEIPDIRIFIHSFLI